MTRENIVKRGKRNGVSHKWGAEKQKQKPKKQKQMGPE